MGQGDLEAEIPLDDDYPKTSSLSFRTSDDKQFSAKRQKLYSQGMCHQVHRQLGKLIATQWQTYSIV
jgi:hypothetical protein